MNFNFIWSYFNVCSVMSGANVYTHPITTSIFKKTSNIHVYFDNPRLPLLFSLIEKKLIKNTKKQRQTTGLFFLSDYPPDQLL